MKSKVLVFMSSIILCFTILTSKAYAVEPISVSAHAYREGIYQLNEAEKGNYTLNIKFTDKDQDATVLVLDELKDLAYKSKDCYEKCTVSDITNKNTIVIIGEGMVALEFVKSK